jgi:hypothetical protein
VQPVRTAAAPIAALRIRKARRSKPAGASAKSVCKNVLSLKKSFLMFTPMLCTPPRAVDDFFGREIHSLAAVKVRILKEGIQILF